MICTPGRHLSFPTNWADGFIPKSSSFWEEESVFCQPEQARVPTASFIFSGQVLDSVPVDRSFTGPQTPPFCPTSCGGGFPSFLTA
jgi:hypothetical protein